MKKKLLLIFSIILLGMQANAQNIRGRVSDAETKRPLVGANVRIQNTNIGTATDSLGNFTLNGEGTLEISSIGYQKYTVIASAEFMEIALKSYSQELQGVEIVGRSAQDYTSRYSFSATKIAIPNKELPQSLNTITKELIADRQAFQLADAVKVVSGVTPSSFYNQFNIRGISQNEEGQIINGMRTRQFYFIQPLTSNIERVEVLKGPASITMSSVDPGGSINMVTKKPLAETKKEISLSAGSFSTIRGTLDFTGALNESKTLLYRLNGAYQEAKSYRDLVNNNSFLLSPSFTYIPNEKTSVNVEMIFSQLNGNLDRGQPIFGAVAGETKLNSTPSSLNLGAANDFFKSKEFILTTSLSHKFSKNIGFNAQYMKQTWLEDLQEHRTTNAFARDINNNPVTSLVAMQFVQRKQNWNIDNFNAYFNFDFQKDKISNKLLVGYDLSSWHKIKGGGQNAARGFLLNDGSVAGSFVLANAANYQTVTIGGVTFPRPNVNYFDLNNPVYTVRNINDYTMNSRVAVPSALTTTHAIYVQNQFKIGKLSALLSLRQEWFEDITGYRTPTELSFNNTALIPRVGLTYSLTQTINVYGTYLTGFQPQSNTVTLMPSTGNFFWATQSAAQFKPLESDLIELGAKGEFFKGQLSVTMAVYEINQRNILMNANDPAQPDLLVQRGADRSRGFEIDITGYITQNWQVYASYSHINAVIINEANPNLIGLRKENTPQNSANLWTRYNFSENSFLKDLGVGLGIQHQSSRIPWFTRDFEVPAFTVFDVALYYNPVRSNIQLALNVGNLFDETYWLGAQNFTRLFPAAPRNFMLSATYKF
ncbi:MAG: TonB-dependent receptor [Microscillaceae bacterium]|jgi:iron complex outermembrane receptor protein|nr:TonB-dependent receptor [Microscillaceae bacterium]